MAETTPVGRNYSMFDADLSGAVLNMHLLSRLMRWMKPYRMTFAISGVLILFASTLQVLLPVVISLVVIDHIIQGETEHLAPDLGMIDATEWLAEIVGIHPMWPRACFTQRCRSVGLSSGTLTG